jgi:hypothetical protein
MGILHQFGCKGTKKKSHTQARMHFFSKKTLFLTNFTFNDPRFAVYIIRQQNI